MSSENAQSVEAKQAGESGLGISPETLMHLSQAIDMTRTGKLTEEHWRKIVNCENPFAGTLAEVRQSFFQAWFKKLGIEAEVPLPMINGKPVPDRDIRDRHKKGQALFFWPGNGRGRYNEIMAAMNQVNYWTVVYEDAGKIAWDPQAQNPFWFWAEVQKNCPRLKTSWNKLMKDFPPDKTPCLLSLEEYAIVFFAYREETGKFLDETTWAWLRTSFGSAYALDANCAESRLRVRRNADLDYPFGGGGGRLAEILK